MNLVRRSDALPFFHHPTELPAPEGNPHAFEIPEEGIPGLSNQTQSEAAARLLRTIQSVSAGHWFGVGWGLLRQDCLDDIEAMDQHEQAMDDYEFWAEIHYWTCILTLGLWWLISHGLSQMKIIDLVLRKPEDLYGLPPESSAVFTEDGPDAIFFALNQLCEQGYLEFVFVDAEEQPDAGGGVYFVRPKLWAHIQTHCAKSKAPQIAEILRGAIAPDMP